MNYRIFTLLSSKHLLDFQKNTRTLKNKSSIAGILSTFSQMKTQSFTHMILFYDYKNLFANEGRKIYLI